MDHLGGGKERIREGRRHAGKSTEELADGSGQIEEVLGTRTRVIQRKLKDVDTLSDREARAILPEIGPLTDEENENGL